MTLSVIITAGVTAYDCSDYVVLHSVEIDEQLFNPESFKPNTNKAVLRLHRTCPYIDEIFAADGDISIAITADAIPVFSGYLTDNYSLKITARGGSDVELTAEDPGIRLLKNPWASTGGLYTSFSGKKVCDSADSANSFVHILAALAGVTVSATVPTISDLLYFSVEDKSKSQYWDILEGVLFDFMHTFYFDASGELCLFAFGGLTGTPSTDVRSDATILQKSLGDAGIEIKKRFIQYKEVNVQYKEGELVTSAVVFRDTTGQGLTDCDIEIAAGGYYPTSCDASTYAYIDYFLEDGRDILAVTSATADFVVDTGITYEFTHIGKSAQIRFYNPTALPKHIRKLKVTGSNVYVVKADSTMTSNEGGGKKLEVEANYLTENADAQSLANLLRYVYANSSALYTFRSYQGVLYPATDLYPSEALYPLGDTLELGGLIRLYDPLWTGLDINCAIYRKKYTVGKAGATFEALGIGTINLADTAAYVPVAKPNDKPIVGLYPTEKALTTTSDTVDFDGQYGIYNGQRYIGTTPDTWTLNDAGQTETQVEAKIVTNAPKNLGRYEAAHPTTHNPGDWWTVYDTDDDPVERGIYYDNAGTVTRISAVSGETGYTTTGALLAKLSSCMADVAWCEANSYGTAANYGIAIFFESFGAITAFINELFAQNIKLGATGYIRSDNYAESGGMPTAGVEIDAATGKVKSKNGIFVDAIITGTLNDMDIKQLQPVFYNRVLYEAAGTYSWTVPENIKNIRVTIRGGGGGGGQGATAGVNGINGGNGGASSFGSYISVTGGAGGNGGSGSLPITGATGGTGGASSTLDTSTGRIGGRNGENGGNSPAGVGNSAGVGGGSGSIIGIYSQEVESSNIASSYPKIALPSSAQFIVHGAGNDGDSGQGGAGGCGLFDGYNYYPGGAGGGAGALRQITLTLTEIYPQTISVVVGAGGTRGEGLGGGYAGGYGGDGQVLIEY